MVGVGWFGMVGFGLVVVYVKLGVGFVLLDDIIMVKCGLEFVFLSLV